MRKLIYLDNAATTYKKPKSVYRAMSERYGNPGRGGHFISIQSGEKVFECRERLTSFFGATDPSQIVLTNNTTTALNIAIKGLLKPIDHVIISGMEHNSVSRPVFDYVSKQSKGSANAGHSDLTPTTTDNISIARPDKFGCVTLKSIKKLVRPNTRLIAVTHASNICGTINPIRDIGKFARDNNILFLVDAAQTAGVLPIDVINDNIDFLAFAGHKSLLGPLGTGGLYVRDASQLSPIIVGGTGSLSESLEQPDLMPDKLESGTLNVAGISGLLEGIKFIEKVTLDKIHKHEQELTSLLFEELRNIENLTLYGPINNSARVGIVSFNITDRDCVNVCSILNEKYHIATRGGLHCAALAHESMGTLTRGNVRLSVSFFTTKHDVKKAVEAIYKIASS